MLPSRRAWRYARTLRAALLLLASAGATLAAPKPARFAAWPDDTALSLAPRRLVLGAVSDSAWATSPQLELRLHPLLFWVLPHVEAKWRSVDAGRWQLSSSHRISYPTPFLALVSREGSGGLLPPTTDVPHALLLSSDAVGSFEWNAAQWVTLRAGAAVALVGPGDDTLLDFPILYQRFAALYAPLVPRASLTASGTLAGRAAYALQFQHFWLPLDHLPLYWANEYSAEAFIQIGENHRLGAGGRLSVARLPVGERTHFLPHLDYQLAF
jgi:hypothetical protein